MSTPQEQRIGAGWIAVLIILLVMLVVGLVLYLRMGVSLDIPRKAPTSTSAHRVYVHMYNRQCSQACILWLSIPRLPA